MGETHSLAAIHAAVMEFLRDNPDPTEQEIRRALAGNLCRCTGYVNIVKAVKAAARKMRTAAAGTKSVPATPSANN